MDSAGFRDMLRQAQAGDRQALERLFGLVMPYLKRVVRAPTRAARAGESVSDRVHNVCQRILEKLGQFRGAGEDKDDEEALALFLGWVRRIAHNVGANAERDRDGPKPPYHKVPLPAPEAGDSSSQAGAPEPPAHERTPSSNVRGDERSRLVLQALHKLPDPTNREIVRLRFFEGRSLRQIAGQLGLTYDVVRERYRVSMRRLQRELEGLQ
jgi:RNA polymerase sigma factor (sigma-70 family)